MIKSISLVLVALCLCACASQFPRPPISHDTAAKLSGNELFVNTFSAHGGDRIDQLKNVNVGITGEWKQLIRRIQPLVTDFKYRVNSQERLLPQERVYAAHYEGPAGSKSVFRSPQKITVSYNGEESDDSAVLSSSALTADAFHLFLLGPLALNNWSDQFIRLSDEKLNGKLLQRIYLRREPGFGFSNDDEVVLWIDSETQLTRKIQITLTGHETTKSAHVEVEYLDYKQHQAYIFPSKFFERVNAPIAIDAHTWRLTGLDINRTYTAKDLQGSSYAGDAARPAAPL